NVAFEYTIENLGTRVWTHPETLGVFLSIDQIIDPSDRLLGTVVEPYLTQAIGGIAIQPVRTQQKSMLIPCNTPTRDYYLGIIRDWNHSSPDRNPYNDVLLLPFKQAPAVLHIIPASSGPCAPQGGVPGPPLNFG